MTAAIPFCYTRHCKAQLRYTQLMIMHMHLTDRDERYALARLCAARQGSRLAVCVLYNDRYTNHCSFTSGPLLLGVATIVRMYAIFEQGAGATEPLTPSGASVPDPSRLEAPYSSRRAPPIFVPCTLAPAQKAVIRHSTTCNHTRRLSVSNVIICNSITCDSWQLSR